MFVIGVFLIANIINYKATLKFIKPNLIELVTRKKIARLGLLTISVLVAVLGLAMTTTLK